MALQHLPAPLGSRWSHPRRIRLSVDHPTPASTLMTAGPVTGAPSCRRHRGAHRASRRGRQATIRVSNTAAIVQVAEVRWTADIAHEPLVAGGELRIDLAGSVRGLEQRGSQACIPALGGPAGAVGETGAVVSGDKPGERSGPGQGRERGESRPGDRGSGPRGCRRRRARTGRFPWGRLRRRDRGCDGRTGRSARKPPRRGTPRRRWRPPGLRNRGRHCPTKASVASAAATIAAARSGPQALRL